MKDSKKTYDEIMARTERIKKRLQEMQPIRIPKIRDLSKGTEWFESFSHWQELEVDRLANEILRNKKEKLH